ncbi:MAG: hypothetical protein JXA54_17420 [Candidatus Heimdallarchaeota archaeon]|nr:hypothetical protein [Candidatus Heimdallarchaeota archaeon]
MKEKGRILRATLCGLVIIFSLTLMIYAGLIVPRSYLLEIKIPGIVEGTAQAIDTEALFINNEVTKATAYIDIKCNNSEDIDLLIGYKVPTEELMQATNPVKEYKIFSGYDLYPLKKTAISEKSDINKINGTWDLLDVGFNKKEYVKADERIWYLKIVDTRNGPWGYERNITQEINGSLITLPDFVPNMNYLKNFAITFNDLTFKTLLRPFFDGSHDIIVPIRGVNHEIEEKRTSPQLLAKVKGTWTSTTTSQGSIEKYAIVFATETYDGPNSDIIWASWGGQLFVFGEDPNGPYRHPNGIYDFGWTVLYCNDGTENTIPIKTTDATDESYLKQMMTVADNELEGNDRLIIFVHGHGERASGGKHITITTNSKVRIGWTNVMHRSDYYEYIEAITDDSTHVFLWLDSCHGNGMDSWSSSDHHYCLEIWSYVEHAFQMAWSTGSTWDYAYWQYTHDAQKDCEAELFFDNADGGGYEDITELGDNIEYWFDNTLHNTEDEDMRTTTFWDTYLFYV